jgi:hypothetical protein
MDLKEIKPLLTQGFLTKQFRIPVPYRVWCHPCERGFMSIEESEKHDREFLNLHRERSQNGTRT